MKRPKVKISNWDEFRDHVKNLKLEGLTEEKALKGFKFKYDYEFIDYDSSKVNPIESMD